MSVSRRTVLRGTAAAGASTALAACDAGSTPPPGQGTAAGEPAAPIVITMLDQVSVGDAVIMLDKGRTREGSLVISQPTPGVMHAISAICTHGGCPVSELLLPSTVPCRCHGSQFLLEDGTVVRGPATTPLAQVKVRIDGDRIARD